MRAAIAVDPPNTANIAPTRIRRWRPAFASGAIPARAGRRVTAGARWERMTTPNATAAITWAITVDHADPGMPRSSPYTNTISSTVLTRFDTNRMMSGR